MLILLPPSETKRRPADGAAFDPANRPAELRTATASVVTALVRLCRGPRRRARDVLGISASQDELLTLDADLPGAPTAPAREVYTGVLYDALAAETLPRGAARRADESVWVASALFGAVALGEEIPAYRLSAGTRLPGLAPLPTIWSDPMARRLDEVDPPLLLDLRSGPYAGLWRVPARLRDRTVTGKIWQAGANGTRTAVSHHNKAVKGALVRSLLTTRHRPRDAASLLTATKALGWRAELTGGRLDIIIEESPPG